MFGSDTRGLPNLVLLVFLPALRSLAAETAAWRSRRRSSDMYAVDSDSIRMKLNLQYVRKFEHAV